MQCLKCGREFPDKRETCIYCGALKGGQVSPKTNIFVSEDSSILITDDQNKEVKLKDLRAYVISSIAENK